MMALVGRRQENEGDEEEEREPPNLKQMDMFYIKEICRHDGTGNLTTGK